MWNKRKITYETDNTLYENLQVDRTISIECMLTIYKIYTAAIVRTQQGVMTAIVRTQQGVMTAIVRTQQYVWDTKR